jgi:hypothetical protein
VFDYAEFETITHIWFSHEHPDHFSPPVLKKIPELTRRRITVLFQSTKDRRVATYCERLGFKVAELPQGREYPLADSVSVTCGTVDADSWLYARASGVGILNVNDCQIATAGSARRVRDQCGAIDILLTQFSYAQWPGNDQDMAAHHRAAQQKLEQIRTQLEVFRPAVCVPFASFVWFSHEENFYMNEAVNTVDVARRVIEENDSECVVLYPGDVWAPFNAFDSQASIAKYVVDWSRIGSRPRGRSPRVGEDHLIAAAQTFLERIRQRTVLWTLRPLTWLGYLTDVNVHLTDLNATYRFSIFRGFSRDYTLSADVALSAHSLLFCFQFDFGIDTLFINGRLQERSGGGARKLSRQFAVARHNNNGAYFPRAYFNWESVKNRVMQRLMLS